MRFRAPATTANLGPGFDCAAVALDLWNELEVVDGGDPDPGHLAVRAFALLADPAGREFRCTDRIPRERGLGSRLVREELDQVREHTDYRVVAQCPFVAHWLAGHPDYQDLLSR